MKLSFRPVFYFFIVAMIPMLLVVGGCDKKCSEPSCPSVCTLLKNTQCVNGECVCLGPEPYYYYMGPSGGCVARSEMPENDIWQIVSDQCGEIDFAWLYLAYDTLAGGVTNSFTFHHPDGHYEGDGGEGITFGGKYDRQPDGSIDILFTYIFSDHQRVVIDGERCFGQFTGKIDTDGVMKLEVLFRSESDSRILKRCMLILVRLPYVE